VWIDNKILRADEAAMGADSLGLKYGAGCFITLRYYGGNFLHFDSHLKRLHDGMRYLEIKTDQFPGTGTIKRAFHQITEKTGLEELDVKARFQVFIATGGGYSLNPDQEISMVAAVDTIVSPRDKYIIHPVDISVIPNSVRPSDLKLSNNLHFMKAWRQAEKAGGNNALMLTVDGRVSGTATGNIFWKIGKHVYTPDESCNILKGVTRGICCKLIQEKGDYFLNKGSYKLEDISHADAVWMTNSVVEIQPVSEIGNVKFDMSDPVFAYLDSIFSAYKKEYLKS